jgi:WD40 repeat protein
MVKAQFSSDGKWVLTSHAQMTRLWDAATGKQITEIKVQGISWLYGSGLDLGGMLMVTAGVTGIVRQIPSGNRVSEFSGHTATIYRANFSPDGKHVVTGGTDGTVFVWETATGKSIAALIGHGGGDINSAQFSRDGKFIVTASDDHTARIWEANTGRQLMILRGNIQGVRAAEFSPDDKFVVTSGSDGMVRQYECEVCGSIEDLMALARTRVTRPLTCEERQTYLHDTSTCSPATATPGP